MLPSMRNPEAKMRLSYRSFCYLGLILILMEAITSSQSNLLSKAPRLTKGDVEKMMKSLSNWGRWGEADQLGTMNLITPAKRERAAKLVKEGFAVSLARNAKIEWPGTKDVSASDRYCVDYHGFTQTHLDALCHIF